MSRRITQNTDITNKELAIMALNAAKISFEEQGEILYLKSGAFQNATLNLKTGTISGDSDFGHRKEEFGLLRQHYAEAESRLACQRIGDTIDERSLNAEGDIVLMCHTG
jgi:hypothetical protein